MARSDAMHALRRILRSAAWCVRTGRSARESVERLREGRVDPTRRRMVAAASAALGSAVLPWRPALAARARGEVAIVGAGLAGLSCAWQLAAKGVRATLFEADDRAGGRCWSLPDVFPGQVAERGGEFIDTTHTTMRGYATAFGLTLEQVTKQPGETRYFFDGFFYDEAEVVDAFRAFVPAMRADLRRIGAPTAAKYTPFERELDLTPLSSYLDSRGAGGLLHQVLDAAYTIEYGREIGEQSALALLLFAHADRRSRFRPFGVFSDERFHVVEGNEEIVRGLVRALPGQIEFGHCLRAVKRLSDGRIRLAFDTGGGTLESEHDAVVLTLPFSVLREIDLDTSLGIPAWKRHAIDALAYGTNSKLMIGFDGRPWYALHSSNGSSYSDLADLQSTWETNPARATSASGILTDYSGGVRGAALDPTAVQKEVSKSLAALDLVYPGAASFATKAGPGYRAHLENWSKSPLAKGSYTCNQPGYFTTIADNEAKPVGNLFFAGEHTSSFYEWQGFMEGAALSGLRAAKEVEYLLRGK